MLAVPEVSNLCGDIMKCKIRRKEEKKKRKEMQEKRRKGRWREKVSRTVKRPVLMQQMAASFYLSLE